MESSLDMEKSLPWDSDIPFLMGSANEFHSKQYFLFRIRGWAAQHGVTMNALYELFVELNNLSNGQLNAGLKKNSNNDLVLDIQRYLPNDEREYIVHICPKDCCSFFGDKVRCDVCQSFRFTKCKRKDCVRGEECNPFDRLCTGPYHGLSQRTATNRYYYRSLLILIRGLLQWCLERNVDLFQISKKKTQDKHSMQDILDGSQAKKNLQEMNSRFRKYNKKRKNMQEISLLLSDFYDGAVLFDRDTVSIWPLIVEFLNCLPTDRSKSGIGQHLIALHHMEIGSKAEQELFSELYVQELTLLEKGIEVILAHNGVSYNYFVQARVIVHRLDTIALQKVAKVQGVGSNAGCALCNTLVGVSRKADNHPFKRVIYFGYRRLLPINHWLRFCGMSKQCCPSGYYEGGVYNWNVLKKVEISELKHVKNTLSSLCLSSACENEDLNYWLQEEESKTTNDNSRKRKRQRKDNERKRNENERNENLPIEVNEAMFNATFSIQDFVNYCEPAHCDLRPQLKFERRPQSFYDTKQSGVVGQSAFCKLDASNNENAMCYDPFHALKNFAHDIIRLLIGDEGCEKIFIEAMQCERRFLGIRCNDKSKTGAAKNRYEWGIPWLLSTDDSKRADAVLNCILIPVGLKEKFNSKNVLLTPGNLKGDELIHYLCGYMTFSLQFTQLNACYKRLFALCSMVCANILSPCFTSIESIDALFNKTVEMLCLFECMLPDTVQKFSHHELLDIVDGLKKFGPVRCWWTLSGERLMKKFKECVPSGGVNALKTMHDAFVWKEKTSLFSYECDSSFLDNNNNFCDNAIKMEGKCEILVLSSKEIDFIMYAVYHCIQISELDEDLQNLKLRSPFFLLYCSYREHLGSKDVIKFKTFKLWLKHISKDGRMEAFVQYGKIIYDSLCSLILELRQWKQIEIYTRAVVNGLCHRARGSKFAIIDDDLRTREDPQGTEGNAGYIADKLRSQWSDKEHYSSWCKFTQWDFNATPMEPKTRYGQLNYFFRINWKHDSMVNNLALASISARKINKEFYKLLQYVPIHAETRVQTYFIPMYVIESTNVAVCGVSGTSDAKPGPMLKTKRPKPILISKTKETNKLPEQNYERRKQTISRLYLIDMDPQRSEVKSSFDESCIPEKL